MITACKGRDRMVNNAGQVTSLNGIEQLVSRNDRASDVMGTMLKSTGLAGRLD